MLKFLKIRPKSSDHSPLFSLPNGAPLTKAWFRSHLVSVLKNCSLSPSKYTGHSFRIGAATTAAEHGVPTAAIKILGRWSSSAFESYLRPDLKIILEAQQVLQCLISYTLISITLDGTLYTCVNGECKHC